MKTLTRLAATGLAVGTLASAGIAAAVTPALPAEQAQLVSAGYVQKASWGLFVKQDGACKITVEQTNNTYFVFSSGKLKATLYPVRPSHVVNAAKLLDDNCQG